MSKLTKIEARNHQRAQELLTKDVLTWEDKVFVLENWREDAQHLNGVAGAFFTPWGLALDLALHVVGDRVIDLCAGIGTLSLAYWQRRELDRAHEGAQLDLVCVESNPDYVAVRRKMLPEATWICADVLDPVTLAGLGHFDTATANPPFGRVARTGYGPRYRGGEFEYQGKPQNPRHNGRDEAWTSPFPRRAREFPLRASRLGVMSIAACGHTRSEAGASAAPRNKHSVRSGRRAGDWGSVGPPSHLRDGELRSRTPAR